MLFLKGCKFTLQDAKKLVNFIDVRRDMEEEDKTSELIAYGIELLYNKSISDFPAEERQKIIEDTVIEINKAMGKYVKTQQLKKDNDFVYIIIDDKRYKSNPFNIKMFYYVNDLLVKNEKVFNIAEDILRKLFQGIISMEDIEDIKENDYLYYEILIDDVSNLIFKTITTAMKLPNYKNPLEENKMKFKNQINDLMEEIDKKLDNYETDIYSIMLENFNIMPSQVDKENAITILELLNSLRASQIRKAIKDEIDEVARNNELNKDMKIEALEQYLMEIGDDE